MKNYTVILFLALICGYLLGATQANNHYQMNKVQRSVASVGLGFELKNTYSSIPCVSETDYQRYILDFHIFNDIPGNLCDDSLKMRLSKALFLAENFKLANGPEWTGPIQDVLQNPYLYLQKHTKSIQYDSKQVGSAAYNMSGDFYLGTGMLTTTPIEFLALLIHEGRHSASTDPLHEVCRHHVRQGLGIYCDKNFNFDSTTGAYSLTVAFLLASAVYQKSIPDTDRNYLKTVSLAYLGSAFNSYSKNLAAQYESLIVLDQTQIAYAVHPFTRELHPVAGDEIKKVVRIESNQGSIRGLYLFYNDQSINGWTHELPNNEYYPIAEPSTEESFVDVSEILPSGNFVFSTDLEWAIDNEKPIVPSCTPFGFFKGKTCVEAPKQTPAEDDSSNSSALSGALLNANGTLKTRDGVIDLKIPDVSRIIQAPAAQLLLLDKSGRAFQATPGNFSFTLSNFQDPEGLGWNSIQPSILKDTLFAVNTNGKVFLSKINLKTKALTPIPFEKSYPNLNTPIQKIVESYSYLMVLDREGQIFMLRHGEKAWSKISLQPHQSKIIDIAISNEPNYAGSLAEISPSSKTSLFAKTCKINRLFSENWLGKYFGFNHKSELYFEGVDGKCIRSNAIPNLAAAQKISVSTNTGIVNGKLFSLPYLEINIDNTQFNLGPYR